MFVDMYCIYVIYIFLLYDGLLVDCMHPCFDYACASRVLNVAVVDMICVPFLCCSASLQPGVVFTHIMADFGAWLDPIVRFSAALYNGHTAALFVFDAGCMEDSLNKAAWCISELKQTVGPNKFRLMPKLLVCNSAEALWGLIRMLSKIWYYLRIWISRCLHPRKLKCNIMVSNRKLVNLLFQGIYFEVPCEFLRV